LGLTRIQLCGRFVVRIEGDRLEDRLPGRQGRMLFAYLVSQPYRTATRDELMEALWHGGPPSAPEIALSALLSKLRRVLGDGIEGRAEVSLGLPVNAQIDLESARNGLHRAESMIHARRWWEAYGPAVTARYISQRQFMRGESAPWIEEIRRDLERRSTFGPSNATRSSGWPSAAPRPPWRASRPGA
jgi:DNA-binding SARP family transcriptional activator